MRHKQVVGNIFNIFAHKPNNLFGASVHRAYSSSNHVIDSELGYMHAQGSSGSLDPYDPKVEKALENWYKLQGTPTDSVQNPQCDIQRSTEKTR